MNWMAGRELAERSFVSRLLSLALKLGAREPEKWISLRKLEILRVCNVNELKFGLNIDIIPLTFKRANTWPKITCQINNLLTN